MREERNTHGNNENQPEARTCTVMKTGWLIRDSEGEATLRQDLCIGLFDRSGNCLCSARCGLELLLLLRLLLGEDMGCAGIGVRRCQFHMTGWNGSFSSPQEGLYVRKAPARSGL